jgi:hypothetical protein
MRDQEARGQLDGKGVQERIDSIRFLAGCFPAWFEGSPDASAKNLDEMLGAAERLLPHDAVTRAAELVGAVMWALTPPEQRQGPPPPEGVLRRPG